MTFITDIINPLNWKTIILSPTGVGVVFIGALAFLGFMMIKSGDYRVTDYATK